MDIKKETSHNLVGWQFNQTELKKTKQIKIEIKSSL